MNQKQLDLNLALLYLTGWEEDSTRKPGEKIFRSWKGYLFEILNELESRKLIHQIRNGKSVIIIRRGDQKGQGNRSQTRGGAVSPTFPTQKTKSLIRQVKSPCRKHQPKQPNA